MVWRITEAVKSALVLAGWPAALLDIVLMYGDRGHIFAVYEPYCYSVEAPGVVAGYQRPGYALAFSPSALEEIRDSPHVHPGTGVNAIRDCLECDARMASWLARHTAPLPPLPPLDQRPGVFYLDAEGGHFAVLAPPSVGKPNDPPPPDGKPNGPPPPDGKPNGPPPPCGEEGAGAALTVDSKTSLRVVCSHNVWAVNAFPIQSCGGVRRDIGRRVGRAPRPHARRRRRKYATAFARRLLGVRRDRLLLDAPRLRDARRFRRRRHRRRRAPSPRVAAARLTASLLTRRRTRTGRLRRARICMCCASQR